MAAISIEGSELVVRLSGLEKLAAVHGDVRVPLAAVVSVAVVDDVRSALRGVRAPGTGLPGVLMYGTLRYPGGRDFAAVRYGRPAVQVDLDPSGAPYGRLTVTVADAAGVARQVGATARR